MTSLEKAALALHEAELKYEQAFIILKNAKMNYRKILKEQKA